MRIIFTIAIVFLVMSCNGVEKPIVRNQSTGHALGTTYNIIYMSNDTIHLDKEIDSVFNAVNNSLSTYIPDSDISKINRRDSTIQVDKMFQDVFLLSKKIYQETNGYFDPTVGSLVNAWGFGPEEKIMMDSVKVDSLLQYVGFDKVSITENNYIVKENPDVYFDFNAIAKGYAIDRIGVMLTEEGITDYLVEVGGELIAKGLNTSKNKAWIVGIDDPQVENGRSLKLKIALENRALASSGNYRKFRIDEETGRKYVHTVDPKTGFTKDSNTLGVTILANDCATADAFATAFMAMDLEDAFMIINENKELEAYIIYLDNKGNTKEFLTSGFKKVVVE
ncbi:FAD:protein FMN transferase [Maribacter sp. 2210JD10-5]|uniref:FAD:protein FMN transferase n=1 Tax=Maribacter sp. 2210JD10-5 TaxID=3386272 RepID=UPI0039BD1126